MNKYANSNEYLNNRFHELKSSYQSDWNESEEVIGWGNSLPQHLGKLDGQNEWNTDDEGAFQRFLPINAYKSFLHQDSIVLIGRTGTGKSSILNRYKYAINVQKNTDYDIAITIYFERLFIHLKTCSFGDEEHANYLIQDIIKITIRLYIINTFLVLYKEEKINEMSEEDYTELYNYMVRLDIPVRNNYNIIEHICTKLTMSQGEKEESLIYFTNRIRLLSESTNMRINDIVEQLIHKNKVLVLADSMDKYDVNEKKVIIMSRALMEVAFKCIGIGNELNYTLKVAIPSEVYRYVSVTLPTRKQSGVVVIEWKYRDLVRMLALKIVYCFMQNKNEYSFAKGRLDKYNMTEITYGDAENIIHTFLPINCGARIPVNFDTIPYCVKHTQKKPRQILMIFNSLIEKMKEKQEYEYFKDHPEEINKYVHKSLENIIEDALNMYNIYEKKNLSEIVSSVLYKKKNFLNHKELMDAIKEASSEFVPIGLTDDDVKRILIESGIVGRVFHENYVEKNDNYFCNQNIVKVVLAQFEYQIKGRLVTKGCTFVLHPACYEKYANIIDHNAWVYPHPADDDGDHVISDLKKNSILW